MELQHVRLSQKRCPILILCDFHGALCQLSSGVRAELLANEVSNLAGNMVEEGWKFTFQRIPVNSYISSSGRKSFLAAAENVEEHSATLQRIQDARHLVQADVQ